MTAGTPGQGASDSLRRHVVLDVAVCLAPRQRPRWRSATTARVRCSSWSGMRFRSSADPALDRIGREDVSRVLTSIWSKHPDIARSPDSITTCPAIDSPRQHPSCPVITTSLRPDPDKAAELRSPGGSPVLPSCRPVVLSSCRPVVLEFRPVVLCAPLANVMRCEYVVAAVGATTSPNT